MLILYEKKEVGLKSNGVEIRGSAEQAVRAVDSGIVIYTGSLSKLESVVIIDYGSLITVYENLSGISVSKGVNIVNPMGFI